MRVIAGKAKRMPLKTVPGNNTRPTTDRIKETLFNMLQDEIYGSRFLDLFAGSGAIGIEALSRGADRAVFVENNRQAAACIKANLEFTRLGDRAEIISADVLSALRRLRTEDPFSLVFMDPPYGQLWEMRVLENLKDSGIIDSGTLIIVEASMETDFSYLTQMGYETVRRKEYKTNVHMFVRRV